MAVANGAYTRTNAFDDQSQERLHPRFFVDSVEDAAATQREGRLICHDEERVEIIFPGNPHTKPVFKVTDEHRQRWPKHYEAFKAGLEVASEGTPLEEWPRLKRGQVLELKFLGFRSVDDLARMDDLACQRVGMGGQSLRTLARAFLDDAENSRLTSQLQAENDKLRSEIAELGGKVTELGTLLGQVHSELQGLRNAPHPIASAIPGMNDPVEQAKLGAPPATPGRSSLDALAAAGARRGRGRPAETEKALV